MYVPLYPRRRKLPSPDVCDRLDLETMVYYVAHLLNLRVENLRIVGVAHAVDGRFLLKGTSLTCMGSAVQFRSYYLVHLGLGCPSFPDFVDTLLHELVHVHLWQSGRHQYYNGHYVRWDGRHYHQNRRQRRGQDRRAYLAAPWEQEARRQAAELYRILKTDHVI